MRGRLPDPVCSRPKAPLAGDPIYPLLQQPGADWIDHFAATPEFRRYVYREKIPPLAGAKGYDLIRINLRPIALNHWLGHRQGVHNSTKGENYNATGANRTTQESLLHT